MKKSVLYIVFILTTAAFYVNLTLFNAIGIGLFFVFILKFINDLGNKIELRNYIVIISLLQWVVAPTFKYAFFPNSDIYNMSVDENVYFSYITPAIIAFIAGLYLPLSKKNTEIFFSSLRHKLEERTNFHFTTGMFLIVIGLLSPVLYYVLPGSLIFLCYLFDSLKYVGVLYILQSPKPYKYIIFFGVFLILLIFSAKQGMFHDLVLWSVFFFIVYSFQNKFTLIKNIFYSFLITFFVLIIQSVKPELRTQIWSDQDITDKSNAFGDLMLDRIKHPAKLFSSDNMNSNVTRANQGWIISRIMFNIPANEPYVGGMTIIRGIQSSILPRIVAGNKATAGGKEYFERFTGEPLAEGTSMDLSTIGEAYGNFGIIGGIIFMFFFGLLINFLFNKVLKYSSKYPTIIFWIPFLFLQMVKAENDFSSGLNHFVKALVIVWFFFYFIRKAFKVAI